MENNQEQPQITEGPEKVPLAGKAYKFIIGFIIVCAVLVFIVSALVLIIKVVPNTLDHVASTFQSITNTDNTSLSTDKENVISGEIVTLSWETQNTDIHSINIICNDPNISIEYATDFFECRDTITFPIKVSMAQLTVFSKAPESQVTFVLESEDNNKEIKTLDEKTIIIKNNNSTEDTTITLTSAESTSTETQKSTSTTYTQGKDLAVQITSLGILNNGQFVTTDNFSYNDLVRAQFLIRNTGDVSVSNWQFRALLPVTDTTNQNFISTIQPTLVPGGQILYTLTFSGIKESGNSIFLVQADHTNSIYEITESNNIASVTLAGGNNSSNTKSEKADFDIDLIATGRMSGNRFIETNNLDTNDEVALIIRVYNNGGLDTERWRINIEVDDPRNKSVIDEESSRYQKLSPGEYIDITLTFDEFDDDGDYDFKIKVDSDNDTSESSKSNNILKFDIDIDN